MEKVRHHPTMPCKNCGTITVFKRFTTRSIIGLCKKCRVRKQKRADYWKNPKLHRKRAVKNRIKFKAYYKQYLSEYIKRPHAKLAKKRYMQSPAGKCADWRAKIRRRHKEAKGKVTKKEWASVLKEHEHKCAFCGAESQIEMDHIIPLSKGGTHSKDNIQPLCRHCNATKHTKII